MTNEVQMENTAYTEAFTDLDLQKVFVLSPLRDYMNIASAKICSTALRSGQTRNLFVYFLFLRLNVYICLYMSIYVCIRLYM